MVEGLELQEKGTNLETTTFMYWQVPDVTPINDLDDYIP